MNAGKQTERQQRIIYSGQLLQDDVKLKDVLRQVGVVWNVSVVSLTMLVVCPIHFIFFRLRNVPKFGFYVAVSKGVVFFILRHWIIMILGSLIYNCYAWPGSLIFCLFFYLTVRVSRSIVYL